MLRHNVLYGTIPFGKQYLVPSLCIQPKKYQSQKNKTTPAVPESSVHSRTSGFSILPPAQNALHFKSFFQSTQHVRKKFTI